MLQRPPCLPPGDMYVTQETCTSTSIIYRRCRQRPVPEYMARKHRQHDGRQTDHRRHEKNQENQEALMLQATTTSVKEQHHPNAIPFVDGGKWQAPLPHPLLLLSCLQIAFVDVTLGHHHNTRRLESIPPRLPLFICCASCRWRLSSARWRCWWCSCR